MKQINQSLLKHQALQAERGLQGEFVVRQQKKVYAGGGGIMELFPWQIFVCQTDISRLANQFEIIVQLQTRIFKSLLEKDGKEGVLKFFDVPKSLARFVNWNELIQPTYLIGRLDLIKCCDEFVCCEVNVVPCVAGAEIYDSSAEYFGQHGIDLNDLPPHPLSDLCKLLAQQARAHGCKQIVILDCSSNGGSSGNGYFSYERMRNILQDISDMPVEIYDETTFPDHLFSPETFCHRGFMLEDMPDEGWFLDRLIQSGVIIKNLFESDIRMDKRLIALLYDPSFDHLLSEKEKETVRLFFPQTHLLDSHNLDEAVATKDQWVFKHGNQFGGSKIYIGKDVSSNLLLDVLISDGLDKWIVQRYTEADTLECGHPNSDFKTVFGLYFYGDKFNGMLLRSSQNSEVVNVTNGNAKIGWAMTFDEKKAEHILKSLTLEPKCQTQK